MSNRWILQYLREECVLLCISEAQSLLLLCCDSCQHAVKHVVVSLVRRLRLWNDNALLLLQNKKACEMVSLFWQMAERVTFHVAFLYHQT